MAMSHTFFPPLNPGSLHLSSSTYNSRLPTSVTQIRKLRSTMLGASKDDREMNPVVISPAPSSIKPLFSFDLPPWTSWLSGAFFILSVPFYRRIRMTQDQVEKTVEAVVEAVEDAAEATERVSSAVAESLPNGNLKEMALKIEEMAEAVDKGAEKTQAVLNKLDEIEAEVDALVDPSMKEDVAALKKKPAA